MSQDKDKYQLWRHPNGTIYICWTEFTEYPSGHSRQQTRRVSAGTKDWATAERYRAQFIAGLNNPVPQAEPTVGYLLERYRNERGIHTRSLKSMDQQIRSTLKPFFGDLLPSHISNKLLSEYAMQRKVSAGTILRALGILKAALRYAEGNRWIKPLPHFVMPVHQPPPRNLWLTREQVEMLIKEAKSPHIKLFIQIALATAARSGAILDLTWHQIDFEKGLIDFGHGYGNKRRATVPINDELMESLKASFHLRQTDHVIEFRNKRVTSIKCAFRRLCKSCNIKASPHVLRHTAATWLVMANVPLSEVARLLGDSEATVEKVYGKHTPDYLRRAVSALSLSKPKAPAFQP